MVELTVEQKKIVAELIELPLEKQIAVREFIHRLKDLDGKTERSLFLAAVDEFIAEHPELLSRLAQ